MSGRREFRMEEATVFRMGDDHIAAVNKLVQAWNDQPGLVVEMSAL